MLHSFSRLKLFTGMMKVDLVSWKHLSSKRGRLNNSVLTKLSSSIIKISDNYNGKHESICSGFKASIWERCDRRFMGIVCVISSSI